jgi:hypothetical protein
MAYRNGNQLKQKFEVENFSGRLADNIKQDFYAMMTVSNMRQCEPRGGSVEGSAYRDTDNG